MEILTVFPYKTELSPAIELGPSLTGEVDGTCLEFTLLELEFDLTCH